MASAFFYRAESGTPLHRAVSAQSPAAANALLQLGASSVVMCDHWTPLCRAAMLRRADLVKLLLCETPLPITSTRCTEGAVPSLILPCIFSRKLKRTTVL